MSNKRPPSPVGGRIADKRAEFERISKRSGRDEAAERAFIENKIQMIETDPNLTPKEKEAAIRQLRDQFR